MGINLGRLIEQRRKDHRIFKRTFAKEAGVSISYIDLIESGDREPQPYVLARISAVLGIPMTDLIDAQTMDQLDSIMPKISEFERKGKSVEADGMVPKVVDAAYADIRKRSGKERLRQAQKTDNQRIAKKIAGEFDDPSDRRMSLKDLDVIKKRPLRKKQEEDGGK